MRVTVQDHGGGADNRQFFHDICRMAEIAALRETGSAIEWVASSECERSFVAKSEAVDSLSALAGVHRAQLIPQKSSAGRVTTVKVSLTVGESMSPNEVLRTYHYPLGQATDHRDGAKLTLQAALEGRTGANP